MPASTRTDSRSRRRGSSAIDACLKHLPENTARRFMMREFLEFETPEMVCCVRTAVLKYKEITHLVSESQDRKLRLAERLELEMHLAICSGCNNFRRQMHFLREACQRYKGVDSGKVDQP